MTQTRTFRCSGAQFPDLVAHTQQWLTEQNFRCQELQVEDGGTLLQVEKAGGWRKAVGMSTALNVVFRQAGEAVTVEIGAGRWIDKAAVGAVIGAVYVAALAVLWPLAAPAAYGIWDQARMPHRIFEFLEKETGGPGLPVPAPEPAAAEPGPSRQRAGLPSPAAPAQPQPPREQELLPSPAAQRPWLDTVREALDTQGTLRAARRDRLQLERIVTLCDDRLKEPDIDDLAFATITYCRACALRLLGNKDQARSDLLKLPLIQPERKRTIKDRGADLLKRKEQVRQKRESERTILADIYRLLAVLSLEDKRDDHAVVFLRLAAQVADDNTERRCEADLRRIQAQFARTLRKIDADDRQVIFCTGDIPSWIPEEFRFASRKTLDATKWEFGLGHPQEGVFYVRHPLRPDRYYDLPAFHDKVFADKKEEFRRLFEALGAREVHFTQFTRSEEEHSARTASGQGSRAGFNGIGASAGHSTGKATDERRSVSQSEIEDFYFQPVADPYLPDDLVWFHTEPSWRANARSVLAGNLKDVAGEFQYVEDFSINASKVRKIEEDLDLFVVQAGVHWSTETEEHLRQRKAKYWKYTVSF